MFLSRSSIQCFGASACLLYVCFYVCNFTAITAAPVPANVTSEMRKRKATNQIISLLKEQQRKMFQRNAKTLSELSLARKASSGGGLANATDTSAANTSNGISNNMAHGQASGKAIKSFKSSVLCTLRCVRPDNVLWDQSECTPVRACVCMCVPTP